MTDVPGRRPLSRFEMAAAGAIVVGLLLRMRGPLFGVLSADGAWYVTMAESLRRFHEFLVPWARPRPYISSTTRRSSRRCWRSSSR